tara:strand:- start:45 stop:392 length:348 start_codon:yes stop_codon:yes gene_type:complete
MYKFQTDKIIKRLSDGVFIPVDENNRDYQQFKDDVASNGVSCVEGIDTVKTVDYKDARIAEYPSLAEQQDMQYWDSVNGTTIWKDKISEIKSKYPKSQVEVIEAVLPDWVANLAT